MTSERAVERELDRLNRLYAALSQVNHAIVWSRSREELLPRICSALVERSGLRMAWIGWHDESEQALVPIARAGDEGHYVDDGDLRVYERPERRGPSATALLAGRPYVCNDLLADPEYVPWRAKLSAAGYRASAAFPFRVQGRVCGTLNVYADERGYFQDKELALLGEAAADISYALDNLELAAERARAEALAEKEHRFAANLIETLPGIFYLYDERGRFLRWNRDFELKSGYSGEEIRGMHPLDFFAEPEKSLLATRIAEVFEKGESSVEADFIAKDGTAIPHFFTGKRILFDGRTCLVGVGVDISERKRAEAALRKSEERYRSTLDNILEGCQLLSFEWRYLYLNGAAAIHNRRPNAELLGKTMPECWPGIDTTHVFAMLARCMTQRVGAHEEIEFVFPDGSTGWFDVRVQPVPEGIFVLSIDISERKQAESSLRQLNDSLELMVGERTRDLKEARERAESADRIKSAFLANMSHELRTPLNSIIGFTGIMLQRMAGPLSDEQTKQLGMVQSSARHLLALINDVLDISKIEAGQLKPRFATFDLRACIEHAVATVRPLADKKGLSLHMDIEPAPRSLESDQRRVEQILLNLLNNAIKFTDRGQVTLSAALVLEAGAAPAAQRCVRIRVADTGIGMKPEDLPGLFQPFGQIDAGTERQREGTGLGLAICRRLAGLLGGSVAAESAWGRGSVFTLVLPLAQGG